MPPTSPLPNSPVTARTPLPVDAIRDAFPALKRRHNNHPVAYFDGPGGTQVPRPVVAAMSEYLFNHNANTHWRYPTSQETDDALLAARRVFADFFNATPQEVVFGNNMTTLTFHVGRALGRAWGPGDEVVVTELDHHANVDPWRAVADERGVTIRSIRMNPSTLALDDAAIDAAVGPNTRLVAIGAASNAFGTINDVRRIADRAHAHRALVFVDAVHYAAHALSDVAALGADFLACSAYKFYGPHVGVLFGREALLTALDTPKLVPAPDTGPERLETGTLNHEGIVGAAAAVDFIASLGGGAGTRRERLAASFDGLHAASSSLFARLWDGLSAAEGVTLYGRAPGPDRTPTLAFTVAGLSADRVAESLAGEGLFLSSGDFYAATAVQRIRETGDGVVRAGLSCYTTESEVDRLVSAVAHLRR